LIVHDVEVGYGHSSSVHHWAKIGGAQN
jgi:hypothetical protein